MIARLWTASYASDKREELERFADEISLPFLKSQKGNRGVIYLAKPGTWITMTLWESDDDYARMEEDADYRKICDGIADIGAIQEVRSVDVFEVVVMTSDPSQPGPVDAA